MGCVVNGPGEAREADIGIAGGKGVGLIFKKGEIIRKVKEEDLVEELLKEIEKLVKNVSISGEYPYIWILPGGVFIIFKKIMLTYSTNKYIMTSRKLVL